MIVRLIIVGLALVLTLPLAPAAPAPAEAPRSGFLTLTAATMIDGEHVECRAPPTARAREVCARLEPPRLAVTYGPDGEVVGIETVPRPGEGRARTVFRAPEA
ncbi:MAG TPA: hypothetical protein VM889_12025 [Candidatus Thermoplasmatota archaeon]|nr:hypothetical protein [Candidatus Thermoplasmatota archaeon]